MYAEGNPNTKKELKRRVKEGQRVQAYQEGPFPGKRNGEATIEGPHYPEPHRWYARVLLEEGVIVKVLS